MTDLRSITFTDTETSGLADTVDEAITNDIEVVEYSFAIWSPEHGTEKIMVEQVMPSADAEPGAIHCASKGWNHYDRSRWDLVKAKRWNGDDCEEVAEYLEGATMGGSNPRFDLCMYKAEFARLGFLNDFPKLGTHRLCDVGALAWPMWAYRLTEKTGLATLTELLGIEHKAHTAMGDVRACIEVFEALCDQFIDKPRLLRELLVELGDDLGGTVKATVRSELDKIGGVL